MTFEDFHRLNNEQLERLIQAKTYIGLEKFCWNDGFRAGYGAAFFLPCPGCPYRYREMEKTGKNGLDQTAIEKHVEK